MLSERNGELREVVSSAVLTLQFVLFGFALGFRCIFTVPLGAVTACVDLEDYRIQVLASVFVEEQKGRILGFLRQHWGRFAKINIKIIMKERVAL